MKKVTFVSMLLSTLWGHSAITVTFQDDGADLRITASGFTVDVSGGGDPAEATVPFPSSDNIFRNVDSANNNGFAPTIEMNAGIPAIGQDNAYAFFAFDASGEQIIGNGGAGFNLADFVSDTVGQGIPYMLFQDASVFFALRLDPIYITPTGGSPTPFSFSGVIPNVNISDTNLILGNTHTVGWGSNPSADNITLEVVPEPSSSALLGAAIFGFVFSRRRREVFLNKGADYR